MAERLTRTDQAPGHIEPSARPSDDPLEVLKSLLVQAKPYVVRADREGPNAHPNLLLHQINAALEHPAFRSGKETGSRHRAYYETHEPPHCPTCECGLKRAVEAKSHQAPIARVTVRESGAGHYAPDDVSVTLYAPGLPPGEHDLYCEPTARVPPL